jgi:hypothetical protein
LAAVSQIGRSPLQPELATQVLQLRDATSQTGVSPPQPAPLAKESPVGNMASPTSGITIEGVPLPATSPVSALLLAVDASGRKEAACRSSAQAWTQTLEHNSSAWRPHRTAGCRKWKLGVDA